MKKLLIPIFAGTLAGLFAFAVATEPKSYHVTLSPEDWQSRVNILENAKAIMDKSTLPANVVSSWKDSVSKFEQEIIAQVQKQMADTVKAKK